MLFGALIILLPTQLTLHFFPSFSLVGGIRIDYLAPSIYLTDIILVLLLAVFTLDQINNKHVALYPKKRLHQAAFLVVITVLGLSLLFATEPILAFIKTMRIVLLFGLAWYMILTQKTVDTTRIYLSIAGLYTTLLAWAQFMLQKSVGGMLWWIGERTFSASTPGIATTTIDGMLVLRPYATLPHPNVLGGFLTVCLAFLLFSKPLFSLGKDTFLNASFAIIILSGIITSFSRSALVATGLLAVGYLALLFYNSYIKRLNNRYFFPGVVGVIMTIAILWGPLITHRFSLLMSQKDPIIIRADLADAARAMIQDHPTFGVGLNNFIISVPEYLPIASYQYLQPVHSIYLLTAAELGILGIALLFGLLTLCTKRLIQSYKNRTANWYALISSLFIIGSIGIVDHYFLTLWQGMLLFTVVIALCLIAPTSTKTVQSNK